MDLGVALVIVIVLTLTFSPFDILGSERATGPARPRDEQVNAAVHMQAILCEIPSERQSRRVVKGFYTFASL
jgi:hypothetical protein